MDESEVNSLVDRVYTLKVDIGMGFAWKMCGALVLNRGKIKCLHEKSLPSMAIRKQIEEKYYKNMGILEMNTLMEKEMK